MPEKNTKKFKKGYQRAFLESLAKQINIRESATVLAMPGVGKTGIMKYMETPDFVKDYNLDPKVIVVILDLNNLLSISIINLYRYILKKIAKKLVTLDRIDTATKHFMEESYKVAITTKDPFLLFEEIRDILRELTDREYQIVLAINELTLLEPMGNTIFNNLKALRDINKQNIQMLFMGSVNMQSIMTPTKLGKLYTIFSYKYLYISRPTREDLVYIFDEIKDKYDIDIDSTAKENVYSLTGGNLWFVKNILKIYNNRPELIRMDLDKQIDALNKLPEILNVNDYVWQGTYEKDREEIKTLISGDIESKPIRPNRYLINTGYIIKEQNQPVTYKTFSPLFDEYVKFIIKQKKTESIRKKEGEYKVNKSDRVIIKDNEIVDLNLTKSEFNVLAFFIENANKTITRDEIAQVIWGQEMYQKYSDYAIDRLISRLRRKIGETASAPKHLKTIKGIGFKFVN